MADQPDKVLDTRAPLVRPVHTPARRERLLPPSIQRVFDSPTSRLVAAAATAGLATWMGGSGSSSTAAVTLGVGAFNAVKGAVDHGLESSKDQIMYDGQKRQHREELLREAEQHVQDITAQLRESQKEADRDLWEQLNLQKESMMTIAALCLAATFDMAVQGKIPSNAPTTLWVASYTGTSSVGLVPAYYFCLALSISMHFSSILAGLASVNRMSQFMVYRVAKQQSMLRKLRETMMNQLNELKSLEGHHDASSNFRNMRQMFSEQLYLQPVLIFNRRAVGHGKHVSDFGDWFYFDGCSTLFGSHHLGFHYLNVLLFKAGIVFLVAAVGMYVEAHLRADSEDNEEATSEEGCLVFWIVCPLCVVFGFLIEIYQIVSPPAPTLQSLKSKKEPAGKEKESAEEDEAEKEGEEKEEDEDEEEESIEEVPDTTTASCTSRKSRCCSRTFTPITSHELNVVKSIAAGDKLFKTLDVGAVDDDTDGDVFKLATGNQRLSFTEIVGVFGPPPIADPVTGNRVASGETLDKLKKRHKKQQETVRKLLKEHPLLEEVIPLLLKGMIKGQPPDELKRTLSQVQVNMKQLLDYGSCSAEIPVPVTKMSGSIEGTTLTVESVESGKILKGQTLWGENVADGTQIIARIRNSDGQIKYRVSGNVQHVPAGTFLSANREFSNKEFNDIFQTSVLDLAY